MVREIDRWFDLNVDVDTRTIYMGSLDKEYDGSETGLDHVMAEYLIKGMHVLHAKNSKPINLLLGCS